ncbi:hypothetical protein ACQP04_23510 [Pseudonocardia halophobica]|uniref:hypothetical protein n=1 Tax=Pseudonocardia halophobica TaxID=29401 RepID=UPI003D89E796
MPRTGEDTTRAPRRPHIDRSARWAVPADVPCDQLLADDQLIEAVRAERVDEHHPDPIARLLARWRADITTAS